MRTNRNAGVRTWVSGAGILEHLCCYPVNRAVRTPRAAAAEAAVDLGYAPASSAWVPEGVVTFAHQPANVTAIRGEGIAAQSGLAVISHVRRRPVYFLAMYSQAIQPARYGDAARSQSNDET